MTNNKKFSKVRASKIFRVSQFIIWNFVFTGVGAGGDPGAMAGNDFVRTVSCYSQAAAAASGGGQSSGGDKCGGAASMAGSSQASSSALSGTRPV